MTKYQIKRWAPRLGEYKWFGSDSLVEFEVGDEVVGDLGRVVQAIFDTLPDDQKKEVMERLSLEYREVDIAGR